MTYGVDECRVCGKAMKPSGPEAMEAHLASLKRRPTMTEKQWRAAGLKAAPTKRQSMVVHIGCCYDCKMTMAVKKVGWLRWVYPTLIITVAFVILVFLIGSYYD